MKTVLNEINKITKDYWKETTNPFENCGYAETFSPNEIKMFHKEPQVQLFSPSEVPTPPYNYKNIEK